MSENIKKMSFLKKLLVYLENANSSSTNGSSTPSYNVVCKLLHNHIDMGHIFRYSLIPAVLLLTLYSFLTVRKRYLLHICHGRPGAIYPYNSIDSNDNRIAIVTTTVITVTFVMGLIQGEVIFGELTFLNTYFKGLWSLFDILILAFAYYPILASVTISTLWSYFFGILYIWLYGVVYILYVFKGCKDDETNENDLAYQLVKFMPPLMSLLFLMVFFPFKFIKALQNRCKESSSFSVNNVPYQMDYIKHVLFKNKEEIVTYEPETMYERIKMNFNQRLYKPIPGFRYSSRLLSSICVGAVIIYTLSWKIIYDSWTLKNKVCKHEILHLDIDLDINETDIVGLSDTQSANPALRLGLTLLFHLLSRLKNVSYLLYHCEAVFLWFILSSLFCGLITIIIIGLLLTSYRSDLLDKFKGQSSLPKFKSENTSILLGCIKLAGYQTASLLWGFVLQVIVMWFILAIVTEVVIIPLRFGYFIPILTSILIYWPLFMVPILIWLIQLLLVRFFLQKRGKVLALTNRRCLFNFMYFMFFYNVIKGLLLTLIRLLKFLICGAWLMSRLDTSCLSLVDGGVKTYVDFIEIENLQNNPILRVWLYYLQTSFQTSVPRNILHCSKGISNRRINIRNRWWLFVMLHKNPGLQPLRIRRVTVTHVICKAIFQQVLPMNTFFKINDETQQDESDEDKEEINVTIIPLETNICKL